MSRLLPARSLLASALLLSIGATGCSRPTSTTGPLRPVVLVESDGTTLDVTVQQELVTRSSGLRGAGRWFQWEEGSTECNVTARLQVSRGGHAAHGETLHLETDPPARLFMDEATCRRRHAGIVASSCTAEGRIAFQLDGVWRVLEAFDQRIWMVEDGSSDESTSCETVLASAGSTVELVARSHDAGACDALLDHDRAAPTAATRCVLDYDSPEVSDSQVRDALVAEVEAVRRGAEPTATLTRWAALVAGGATAGNAQDMEAALYTVLLEGEPDFRADQVRVGLGLAFAPSRVRRTAFIEAAIARCESNRFGAWQRTVLAMAAEGLGDALLSARVATACGVDPARIELRFPSHLEP